jgi:WD40 repeat protein
VTFSNEVINKIELLSNGHVASCSEWNFIKIWNLETKDLYKKLFGHQDSVEALAQLKESDVLASGSCDSAIILWNYIKSFNEKSH